MKSVKEVSQLSGVSVRTLHYYDESISSPQGNPVPVGDRDYMMTKLIC